jgi:hypothetical protein
MAEIFGTAFDGSTLPGGMSSDHRGAASHTVSGGVVTLTASGSGQAIIRQTTAVTAADADAATFQVVSADAFRLLLTMRTAAGDATFVPAVSVNGSDEYYTCYYRIATGTGGARVVGPTIASRPFVRFRRSGATSMIVETAATYGGSYTLLDTFLVSDGLWDPGSWTAAQAEAGTVGGAGSVVLASIGDGTESGGAPTSSAAVLQYLRDQARMAGIHFY